MQRPALAVVLVLASFAGVPCANEAAAQDATLEVSESVLNQAMERISVLSDGGVRRAFLPFHSEVDVDSCAPIGVIKCPPAPAPPAPAPAAGGALGPGHPAVGLERVEVPLLVCARTGGAVISPYRQVSWQWWISGAHLTIASGGMTLTARVTTHVQDVWETSTRSSAATVRFDPADNRLKLDIADFKVSLGDAGTVDVARLLAIAIPIEPQRASVSMPDGSTRIVTGGVASVGVAYQPGLLKISLNTVFQ
jgi:hypothetical protein